MEYLLSLCHCGHCEWVPLDDDNDAEPPHTVCVICLDGIVLGREPPDCSGVDD